MRGFFWKSAIGFLVLAMFSGCGLVDDLLGSDVLIVEVPRGGSVTKTVTVDLPDPETGELAADVMWLVDLSGSFGDDLALWKEQTNAIAGALRDVVPNFRVALSSFVDAPCGEFGDPTWGDYGYRLELAFSSDVDRFSETVNNLEVLSGNDMPESQLEAMYQAMTGLGREVDGECANASIPPSNPNWGGDRLRFLLVSTDAPFHTPTDVDEYGVSYPYPTTVDNVIETAQRLGVTIFFFNGGDIDASASDIASATGGLVLDVGTDSSGLVDAIANAVNGAVTQAEVRLVPVGDDGLVSRIEPDVATVDLTTTRSLTFSVTFTDSGLAAGEVNFELEIRVNGSLIGSIPVVVVLE